MPEEYNRLVEADDPRVSAEFTERLREEGYDSVYWNGDGRKEWMVLEPTQIKSATDNIGTFDPGNPDIRYSRSGIFTGTAADYANRSRQGGVDDGPSVKKIGTGEGSQVYGWGLRGTTIRKNAERDSFGKRQKNLYKQTFFTNRAPGDESHLLDWNGTTTLEQKQWFADEANKEFGGNWIATERGLREGDGPRFDDDKGWKLYNIAKMLVAMNKYTAGRVEQLASEFLYRAGIDGVKAPDIRYGKTSDKDELGNIYVAFSDEHIRVDHKWTDGQMRYSHAVRPSALGDGKQRYYGAKLEDAAGNVVRIL